MIAEVETVQVEQQALSVVERAKKLTINNDEQYALAADFLTGTVKAMLKEIDATFDPAIEQAHKAHKAVLAAKKSVADPLLAAEKQVKGLISDYSRKQEEARRAAEAELRRLAQAEAERQALEAAVALEKAGKREEAAAIIEQPIVAAPIVLPKATPTVAGVSMRDNWRFRVVDASKVKPEYLMVDEVKVGQIVRALKEAAGAVVGGIEVYNERTVGSR